MRPEVAIECGSHPVVRRAQNVVAAVGRPQMVTGQWLKTPLQHPMLGRLPRPGQNRLRREQAPGESKSEGGAKEAKSKPEPSSSKQARDTGGGKASKE